MLNYTGPMPQKRFERSLRINHHQPSFRISCARLAENRQNSPLMDNNFYYISIDNFGLSD